VCNAKSCLRGAHLHDDAVARAQRRSDEEIGLGFAYASARRIPMRVADIRVIALLGGLALVGCGASNIDHGPGGTGGNNGGGTGTGGGGGTSGGGTGGTGGGGGSDNNCGVQNFMLQKGGTPDLLLVQDRSGSMTWSIDGTMKMNVPVAQQRWTQITAAINQVVGQVNTIDWGLMFFGPDDQSCNVPSAPQVACGMGTASQITSTINATKPNGGTPTAEAINAGVQYFMGNNDGHAHYMLLATDGEPSCDDPIGNSDTTNAENAVMTAAQMGVKTIVVGIGASGADAALTVMANNGGMPDTTGTKPYYQVNSTSDLVTALDKIAGQIVSCSYALQMAPPNPNYVEIDDNNGMKIPRDTTHMNGWDFGPGNLSINFYGAACDNLQKGVTTGISAVFGCPPVG
jgi:von Willebrand factor type A domain